jgi:BirA family biotin operon repressor/biotin-[acetyl-CoA-carboxylase] ligase
VGIGVNTGVREFPPELRTTATSLQLTEAGEALAPLLSSLECWIASDEQTVLAAWRRRDALLGSPVRWRTGDSEGELEGIARGVDDGGALVVDTRSGERVALSAGEVHLVR